MAEVWNVYVGSAPRARMIGPASMVSWLYAALARSSGARVTVRSAAWESGSAREVRGVLPVCPVCSSGVMVTRNFRASGIGEVCTSPACSFWRYL